MASSSASSCALSPSRGSLLLLLLSLLLVILISSVAESSSPPSKLHQVLVGSFGFGSFELRKIDIVTGKFNHSERPLYESVRYSAILGGAVAFDPATNTGFFPMFPNDAKADNTAYFLAFNLTSCSNVSLLREYRIPEAGLDPLGVFFDPKTNSLITVNLYAFGPYENETKTVVGSYSLESHQFKQIAVFDNNTFISGGGGLSGEAIGFDIVNRVVIFPNITNEFVSVNVDTKVVTIAPRTTALVPVGLQYDPVAQRMLGLFSNNTLPTDLLYGVVNSLTFEVTLIRAFAYLDTLELTFVVLGQIALNQVDYIGTFIVGNGYSYSADMASFDLINGDVLNVGQTNPSQPQGMLWINP
eukprot:TRINITY_DN685_c0_g1_i4.p1 TRINITY_DN685_c0_g1~~TRINITY_DN685_c0_g1_i4.p1  ORF type:complete len:357 (-),score=73.17 TRINITY_DN685_c0_g1_i4:129-1199(-)